jgi:hypothetical protein
MGRKSTFLFAVILLFALVLGGCSGGPAPAPAEDCMAEISTDAAMSGQEKAMAGALTGSIELTSSEISSLATGLIQSYAPNLPVEEVIVCVSPDGVYEKVVASDGTVIEVVADASIVDNRLVANIQAMAVNGQAVPESTIAAVEAAYNRAFDDPSLAVAGDVEFGDDVMTITLGQ